MISAPTGGRPKVIGNNMATVAIVPMPGSTPTRVADQRPDQAEQKVDGADGNAKAEHEIVKEIGQGALTAR